MPKRGKPARPSGSGAGLSGRGRGGRPSGGGGGGRQSNTGVQRMFSLGFKQSACCLVPLCDNSAVTNRIEKEEEYYESTRNIC